MKVFFWPSTTIFFKQSQFNIIVVTLILFSVSYMFRSTFGSSSGSFLNTCSLLNFPNMDPYQCYFKNQFISLSRHNTCLYFDIIVKFKLSFVSCRCDVGFPDACRILEGDNQRILKTVIWIHIRTIQQQNKQTNSVAFSPQANYTDRATAACRRS
jgi:hypothetical protein